MSATHSPATAPHETAGVDAHNAGHAHAVSPKILLAVYGALLVLTVITVAVTGIELGAFNVWVALFVALLKAALVAMYFMHLRWDNPFNGIILIAAMFFVVIFIGIAVLDSKEYKPNYDKPSSGQVMAVPNAR